MTADSAKPYENELRLIRSIALASHVLVTIYCDTEDIITPEADDASLNVARLMEKNGIRVNFKLVGEKARTLKRRNRKDVLDAISHHELGYHSDLHSVHPTIPEYVGNLGWDEGSVEFEKRERPGYEDLKRIFGKTPTCYGHPGMCWVPQSYPALRKWGIPVYIDETHTITPLNDRPYWYCNTLNLLGFGPNMLSLDAGGTAGGLTPLPDDWLLKLKDKFVELYKQRKADKDVALIGLYCHPTTYVTEEFWDLINYTGGKNPEQIRIPRVKAKEHTERDYVNLDSFLNLAKSLPHLHFITASDALSIYHDRSHSRNFTKREIKMLSRENMRHINYRKVGKDTYVSAAEAFSLLLQSLAKYSKTGKVPARMKILHPMGPKVSGNSLIKEKKLKIKDFLKACENEKARVRKSGYLSPTVKVHETILSTADMFATCCRLYLELSSRRKTKMVTVKKGDFQVGKSVTEEGSRKDWEETYTNPPGFDAPKQTELARLQTWTLKPASPDAARLRKLKNRNTRP